MKNAMWLALVLFWAAPGLAQESFVRAPKKTTPRPSKRGNSWIGFTERRVFVFGAIREVLKKKTPLESTLAIEGERVSKFVRSF